MIDRLAALALVALIVSACSRETQSAPAAPVWAVSGSCSVSYDCATGLEGVNNCPATAVSYCTEGAACNPNDATPCLRIRPRQDALSCDASEALVRIEGFDVLACSPNGRRVPAERAG